MVAKGRARTGSHTKKSGSAFCVRENVSLYLTLPSLSMPLPTSPSPPPPSSSPSSAISTHFDVVVAFVTAAVVRDGDCLSRECYPRDRFAEECINCAISALN